MKRLLLPICLVAITSTGIAQKDRSKKVDTKYLSLPSYDISETDPSTLLVEYAMDNGTFGVEKLKDTKATCIPKGGKLKDAVEVTTYYYALPYTQPASHLVARSADGEIIYSTKTSEKGQSTVKFGYQKCEYWVSDKLKKDWATKAANFKSAEHKKYEDLIYTKATELATNNLFLSYINQEFEVYSAKGKLYDYVDLDAAFDKTMQAYEGIASKGPNANDFSLLKEAIATWEKELETLDLEDKKARITKDIGKGLHENCARAYMYMYDFDNARKHGGAFLKLFGNFSNNRSTALKALVMDMEKQKIAAEKNAAIMQDISALNKMAQASASNSVNVKRLSSADFARLASDDASYRMGQHSEVSDARKKDEEAAIASGELNPYQKYVMDIAGGKGIMMTMKPSPLTGIPALKELPAEMCELEGITQLLIMNNEVETISPAIGKLTELKKLDLTGNNIKTLPPEIGQLANLETLRLGKNPIESFPEEIGNCTKLKTLVLKGSVISADVKDQLARLLPDCKIKY